MGPFHVDPAVADVVVAAAIDGRVDVVGRIADDPHDIGGPELGLEALDQGGHPGDVGRRLRGPRREKVGEVAFPGVPLGHRSKDVDTGRGDVHLGAGARKIGRQVVVIGGGDGEDITVVGGGIDDRAPEFVSGRGDDDDPPVEGVLAGVLEEWIVEIPAHAEVDDGGPLVGRPDQTVDDPAVKAHAVGARDLDGEDRAVPGDAGDTLRVVGVRRGDAGDVGAVPVVVGRVIVIVGEVVAWGDDLGGEVGVRPVDARVEDGDDHSGIAQSRVPCGRGLDVGAGGHLGPDVVADIEDPAPVTKVVLIGNEERVVGRIGQAGPVVGPGLLDVAVTAEHGQGLGHGKPVRRPDAVNADLRDQPDR